MAAGQGQAAPRGSTAFALAFIAASACVLVLAASTLATVLIRTSQRPVVVAAKANDPATSGLTIDKIATTTTTAPLDTATTIGAAPPGTTVAPPPPAEPTTVTPTPSIDTAPPISVGVVSAAPPRGVNLSGIGVQGLDPIRLGTTVHDAEVATGLHFEQSPACGLWSVATSAGLVTASVDSRGLLRAIQLKSTGFSTFSGARVGMSAGQVLDIYRSKGSIRSAPSPYADIDLLIYRSDAPEDAGHEVVFWSDRGKVSVIVAALGSAGEAEIC